MLRDSSKILSSVIITASVELLPVLVKVSVTGIIVGVEIIVSVIDLVKVSVIGFVVGMEIATEKFYSSALIWLIVLVIASVEGIEIMFSVIDSETGENGVKEKVFLEVFVLFCLDLGVLAFLDDFSQCLFK